MAFPLCTTVIAVLPTDNHCNRCSTRFLSTKLHCHSAGMRAGPNFVVQPRLRQSLVLYGTGVNQNPSGSRASCVPRFTPAAAVQLAGAPPPGRAVRAPDPWPAPAKSSRVTCARAKAGCRVPGLLRIPSGQRVVLSGRDKASVGSRGSGAKAVGRRRTQAERTRAAMATTTQDALRRGLPPKLQLALHAGDVQSGA